MKNRFLPVVFAALATWCSQHLSAADPLKVLIVDGYGNHDWQRTTGLIRGIVEPLESFEVSVSTCPGKSEDPAYAAWKPDFKAYDVVIQTCNDINRAGPMWPEPARKDLETFVGEGGGLFVFHSGNNAFPKWDAYNSMIGLGWRDKNFGVALRVKDDESIEKIPAGVGSGTSHGDRTDRQIHRLGDHPIHAGLPRVWMTPLIEVYTHARGPAENLTVLSWAEEPKTKERWPVEWTVEYGKGRVYTSTFGHVWKDEKDPVDMRCAGFQTILIRTLQWLAKKEITLPVPADFPTSDALSLRP